MNVDLTLGLTQDVKLRAAQYEENICSYFNHSTLHQIVSKQDSKNAQGPKLG